MANFDLSVLEQDETAIIQLVHPATGDEIGASVTVYGQDSEIFRAETRKAETKFTEYARRNRGKMMPPEDREKLDRSKVVACVKSVDGLAYKGEAMTDAQAIFDRFPWIFEQVVSGIMERANFIKAQLKK